MGLALNETDIQFRNQHTVSTAVTTNVQPHANGKKSPAPPNPDSPIKYMQRSMSLKEEWRRLWQKKTGKADMAKENVPVRMPEREIHAEETGARNLVRQSKFIKERKGEGEGRRGKDSSCRHFRPLSVDFTENAGLTNIN